MLRSIAVLLVLSSSLLAQPAAKLPAAPPDPPQTFDQAVSAYYRAWAIQANDVAHKAAVEKELAQTELRAADSLKAVQEADKALTAACVGGTVEGRENFRPICKLPPTPSPTQSASKPTPK